MRKWTRTIPTFAAFAVSAVAASRVPAVSPIDLSRLLPPAIPVGAGEIARLPALLLMPFVSLAVLLLFSALERVRGTQTPLPAWWLSENTGSAAVQRFEPTYNTVVFTVTSLFVLAHFAVIASVLGSPDWIYRMFTVILGFGFMAAGNVMPRVRPNWIMGLRTPRTLADPVAWSRTHRLLGMMLIVIGLLTVLLSLVAPRYALVTGLAALLVSLVMSHTIGTKRAGAGGALA